MLANINDINNFQNLPITSGNCLWGQISLFYLTFVTNVGQNQQEKCVSISTKDNVHIYARGLDLDWIWILSLFENVDFDWILSPFSWQELM